jgi:predicted RNA-binding Zn ribbon-like protein
MMTAPFELLAGRLCLDFVNTVSERPLGPRTREDLPDYGCLLQWALEAGVLTARGAQALARRAAAQPRQAQRALDDAIALRERLHRLFRTVIDRRPPDAADLERFGAAAADALARRRISWHRQRYAWEWPGAQNDLASVLWPVLLSAQGVLCSEDHSRLGACSPPDGCGWLYYDTSKNRSRRWCSMATCGNSAKARRHYARQRADSAR